MAENKTALLPTNKAQNRLTNFVSQSDMGASTKNASVADYARNSALYDRGNPFMTLSYPVFKLSDKIVGEYETGDITKIHSRLTEEIDRFSRSATEMNLDGSKALVARYLLCAYIDEMIGTTYWGRENNWAKDSLLSFYYQEAYGGEKFFQLLSKLLASPANHIDLLELMYICISLGFEGKYRITEKGRIEIEAIRDNLYKQIRKVRGHRAEDFYVKRGTAHKKQGLLYGASNTILIVALAIILLVINFVLGISLTESQNEVIQMIGDEQAKIIDAVKPNTRQNIMK
jgi:type VI secretion system protein ImpK